MFDIINNIVDTIRFDKGWKYFLGVKIRISNALTCVKIFQELPKIPQSRSENQLSQNCEKSKN